MSRHTLSFHEDGLQTADLVIVAPGDPLAMARAAAGYWGLAFPYHSDPSMQAPRMVRMVPDGFAGAACSPASDYEFGMMAEARSARDGVAPHGARSPSPLTRGEQGSSIAFGERIQHRSLSPA